jgi:glucose-6-phosphate-specific signal transduction histidine kinase
MELLTYYKLLLLGILIKAILVNKMSLFAPYFIIIPFNVGILIFKKHYNVFDKVIASITYTMEIIIFHFYVYNSKDTTD